MTMSPGGRRRVRGLASCSAFADCSTRGGSFPGMRDERPRQTRAAREAQPCVVTSAVSLRKAARPGRPLQESDVAAGRIQGAVEAGQTGDLERQVPVAWQNVGGLIEVGAGVGQIDLDVAHGLASLGKSGASG